MRYLDESDVTGIVQTLTGRLFPSSPAFRLAGEEGRGRLLSALAQPQWPVHRTFAVKAAVLHYHLNRDHPYVDGNKRLALVATETFLTLNAAILVAANDELEALALGVADGSIDSVANRRFFVRRCVRLNPNDGASRDRARAAILRAIRGMSQERATTVLDDSADHLSRFSGVFQDVVQSLRVPD